MKRVLLMTVLGLAFASNAMAEHSNARFGLLWKPNLSGFTFFRQPCGSCATGDSIVTYVGCPNAANLSDLYTPNWSPSWNGNTVEADTIAAKIYNPVPCTSYNVEPPNGTAGVGTIYVTVGRAGLEGLAGASFGVDWTPTTYAGVSATFTACADGIPFYQSGPNGEFPRRQGGVRITWLNCQHTTVGSAGVHAVVGYFKLGTPTAPPNGLVFSLTPNFTVPNPELSVADCSAQEINLYTFWGPTIANQLCGKLGFGTAGVGYNPCLTVPVEQTTWGKVKNLYKN